jgi:hypothetical protein
MKKLLLLTGPQGSGNHIFSRVFSVHPEVKGWDAILEKYWVPTDEDRFAKYFIDPDSLTIDMFIGWEYFVTNISCPFVYNGKEVIPNIQGFINKALSLGVDVSLGIVVRDEGINAYQQQRLRGRRTLDIALDTFATLHIDNISYLSMESLFLHKQNYLRWLSRVMDFPIDFDNQEVMSCLTLSPNDKYIKYVDDYWLDDVVKLGLIPFDDRLS